jgi:hypothetical protein
VEVYNEKEKKTLTFTLNSDPQQEQTEEPENLYFSFGGFVSKEDSLHSLF